MEYIPDTLYKFFKGVEPQKMLNSDHLKVYMSDLFKSLQYIHSLNICHRDIKPQNMLIDFELKTLKLCDFGSAKQISATDSNISYICSRFYRAPELIYGATKYSMAVDIWSAGCVMAEGILGRPIFAGKNSADQLVEIIKVLGLPTAEDLVGMKAETNNSSSILNSRTPLREVILLLL